MFIETTPVGKSAVFRPDFGDRQIAGWQILSQGIYRINHARSTLFPAYTAESDKASSIRISWLYLAKRSERDSEPVLICPQLVATARSAIVVSSVSPERCEKTVRQPDRCAISTASSVSDKVPIWLTLTSKALATPRPIPSRSRCGLVTNKSSPTS